MPHSGEKLSKGTQASLDPESPSVPYLDSLVGSGPAGPVHPKEAGIRGLLELGGAPWKQQVSAVAGDVT